MYHRKLLHSRFTYVDSPKWYHVVGFGMPKRGDRITTPNCIRLENGRVYRVYAMGHSSNSVQWIIIKGIQFTITDCDAQKQPSTCQLRKQRRRHEFV